MGIFLLDLVTPPGAAVWMLYVLALWLAFRSSHRRFPLTIAVVCTGLIAAGYVLSAPEEPVRFALINRALGVLTLWTLALSARRQSDMVPLIREYDTFFTSFMDHLPAFAWVKAPDGRYVYANTYFCEVFGFKSDKVLGRTDAELFPPDTAKQFVENDRYVLTTDQELRTIETFRIDGRQRYGLVRKFPIRDEGTIRLVGGVAIDLTEAKQAEEALRESRERFSSAFRDAAIGMALVGTDGRWLQVNRALCHIVGYSEEELLATTFQAITHPDDLDADLGYVNQMLRGEIPTYQMEKRYFHKRGHIVWILLSVSLVRDQEGKPLYFISQIQDITQRKLALEQLQAAHDRLRDMTCKLVAAEEEERRRLSRELHDEFGQTLTCLKFDLVAVIKSLSRGGAAVRPAEVADKVRAMANLVDDIIESTRRIATGLRPSILDELGLAAAIGWQTHHFQTRTGIVCETIIDPRLAQSPVEATLSTTIFRILQELLTNVQRHAQATRVRIALFEKENALVLSVQDNGKGIEPARTSGSATLGIRGIQERVTLFGGEFSLHGEPGQGTSAEVKLPRREATRPEGSAR